MSAIIVSFDPKHTTSQGSEELTLTLRRQGFARTQTVAGRSGVLVWAESQFQTNTDSNFYSNGDSCIAVVGTIVYKEKMAAEAIRELLEDFVRPNLLTPFDFAGNFLAVIQKHDEIWMFGDPVGMIKFYHLASRNIYSTSWIACADLANGLSVDRAASLQYLILGGNYDLNTPFQEIKIAEPTRAHTRLKSHSVELYPTRIWLTGQKFRAIDDAADAAADLLTTRMNGVKKYYGGTTVNAISGGFDSRLLLATLQRTETPTHLYVFGETLDEDVANAKLVCQTLDLPLEHINKRQLNEQLPPLDDRAVQSSMYFFDGIPADGFFDRGADRQTRIKFGSIGSILLNGGAGEIMRNFLNMPNASYTSNDVVKVFYSQYLPSMFIRKQDEEEYRYRIAKAIDTQLGGNEGSTYDRKMIELAYPLLRARYWVSRNNSVANRTGAYWTLPLDPVLVSQCYNYPLQWKNYGRIEAKIIDKLSRSVAQIKSGYGFDFTSGPSISYQLVTKIQQLRPPTLRQYSTAIKVRLGKARMHSIAEISQMYSPNELLINKFYDTKMSLDSCNSDRILSLEYLIRRYNARISD